MFRGSERLGGRPHDRPVSSHARVSDYTDGTLAAARMRKRGASRPTLRLVSPDGQVPRRLPSDAVVQMGDTVPLEDPGAL
jgi:hypothetical protein